MDVFGVNFKHWTGHTDFKDHFQVCKVRKSPGLGAQDTRNWQFRVCFAGPFFLSAFFKSSTLWRCLWLETIFWNIKNVDTHIPKEALRKNKTKKSVSKTRKDVHLIVWNRRKRHALSSVGTGQTMHACLHNNIVDLYLIQFIAQRLRQWRFCVDRSRSFAFSVGYWMINMDEWLVWFGCA